MDTTSNGTAENPGLAAAVALRALGHAMVAHQAPDAVLDQIAEFAEQLTNLVRTGPAVTRNVADELAKLEGPVPADGVVIDHGENCPVSGQLNPLGLAMVTRRVGDEAVAEVTLGPAAAGPPGVAHGGVVASLLDDVMGFVLGSLQRVPGVTARLEIQFRRPMLVDVPLTVRGRLRNREGRKLFIDAFVECEGFVVAEASALFLVVERPATATVR